MSESTLTDRVRRIRELRALLRTAEKNRSDAEQIVANYDQQLEAELWAIEHMKPTPPGDAGEGGATTRGACFVRDCGAGCPPGEEK